MYSQVAAVWSCFSFIYMLVIADQAWHNIQQPSLLELFLFRCVSIACSTRTKQMRYLTPPTYPHYRATSYELHLQADISWREWTLSQSVPWRKGHRRCSKRWFNHLTLSAVPLIFTHSHSPVTFPVICEPGPKYDYIFIWIRRYHENDFL